MRRQRKAKIVATLGPASDTPEQHPRLVRGRRRCLPPQLQPWHRMTTTAALRGHPRRSRTETGRPIGVLVDLQGPKLRVGKLPRRRQSISSPASTSASISSPEPGDATARAAAPSGDARRAGAGHPAAARRRPLPPDGAEPRRPIFAETIVVTGGHLTDRKGVNVPDVLLGLVAADREGPHRSALRPRPRRRLGRALLRAAPGGRRRGAQG